MASLDSRSPNKDLISDLYGYNYMKEFIDMAHNGGNILAGNRIVNLGANTCLDMLTLETKWAVCLRQFSIYP